MNDLSQRAIEIVRRQAQAEQFTFWTVGIRGAAADGSDDWHPRPHYCHDNVALWVARCPEHKHVKGYILFGPNPLLQGWIVQAHSLVELEEGGLIDITPSGASQTYPFVRHVGTEEEFAEFAKAISVVVSNDAV